MAPRTDVESSTQGVSYAGRQRRSLRTCLVPAALFGLLLGGCSTLSGIGSPSTLSDSAPRHPVDISRIPDAVPRAEKRSKYGNPPSYTVNNRRYEVLNEHRGYVERGVASWYGTKFHGKRTSSGEPYNMYAMTAAHRSLPLPTYAEVTNLENGRSVTVKINDRGPFKENRILDLSYAAAYRLGITETGTGLVEIRAIDPTTPMRRAESAATAGSAAGNPEIYLQLGAFSERDNAERLLTRLRGILPARIRVDPIQASGTTLYRVRVGPLAGVNEADRLSKRLLDLGIDPPRVVIN